MSSDDYRSSARFYDYCISPLLRGLRQDIFTYINYKKFTRVIDFCCGTGDQLSLLDGPGMSLCGIDNSLAMLQRARINCSKRVDLHLLDAEHDLLGRGTFDCAIISFGLHDKHPAVAGTIFNNCRSVIRQGGSLILADYSEPPGSFPGKTYGTFLIPLIERLAGTTHHGHYQRWIQQGGLEGFLSKQCNRYDRIEIISQPFDSAALCCALAINDDSQARAYSYALLNQTLLT